MKKKKKRNEKKRKEQIINRKIQRVAVETNEEETNVGADKKVEHNGVSEWKESSRYLHHHHLLDIYECVCVAPLSFYRK